MTLDTSLPPIGFGLDELDDRQVAELVPAAWNAGFRAFDTAQLYGNEAALGRALKHVGMAREEVFVTTKVMNRHFSEEAFIASIEESLARLQLECVDLLLVHWPGHTMPVKRQIELLNEAHRLGMASHIGVSNYNSTQLAEAVEVSEIPITTNQVEVHPFLDQRTLRAKAQALNVPLTGFFVMAMGDVPQNETLKAIGARYDKTAAQVALRWVHQLGDVPLTRSTRVARIPENLAIFDFTLSPDEMDEIARLARPDGRIVSPANLAPNWD
ncbi:MULTISPECIES: aldo/keto reductase [unclassified Halomonas]|uniref:aldo/keto reductase n=1 Tax=unclassified Halomonas TaxID=2609666 RepID=UPI00209E65C0|nr:MULTISPECIES: aldo/keto reductase [unclassified Halomonas]MCP1313897.1 aldo/keto reductase [Halomonas sp. 707D7]MCP1325562.1 aldo/keto reductase [Halomonas sp. 707D4]